VWSGPPARELSGWEWTGGVNVEGTESVVRTATLSTFAIEIEVIPAEIDADESAPLKST